MRACSNSPNLLKTPRLTLRHANLPAPIAISNLLERDRLLHAVVETDVVGKGLDRNLEAVQDDLETTAGAVYHYSGNVVLEGVRGGVEM